MKPRRYANWDETGRETQLAQLRKALEAAGGNITRAGEALGFKRSFAFQLVRDHKLNDYAAELRVKRGGNKRGRPRGVKQS